MRPFKFIFYLSLGTCLVSSPLFAEKAAAPEFKKYRDGIYNDVFIQNIHGEITHYLKLDHLTRALTGKKLRAQSANVFDEVPDNAFFTNRHGRGAMTLEALRQGYRENQGPEASGKFSIYKGKFGDVNFRVFAKDSRGDSYLLKFELPSHPELGSAAEIIASRILYAAGYNVPQNTLLYLTPEQITADPEGKIKDGTGFKKKLTPEMLENQLMFFNQNEDGKFRLVASKVIPGELKGGFRFEGRRRNDPQDPFEHENRREVRALRVFQGWLNNTDVRPQNSMSSLVEENGKLFLKHYLVDLDSSLGSDKAGAKPPHISYEHTADYGETVKAIFSFGLWEKPWQKRWRKAGEKEVSPEIGYVDSEGWRPEAQKTQLPALAFKMLTRADGFWAAKIIMKFTDEALAEIVKEAEYSDPQTAEKIAKILRERRDAIGRYWFTAANPLDGLRVEAKKLTFEDLGVKYGFFDQNQTQYRADIFDAGKKKKKEERIFNQAELVIDPAWGENLDLKIYVSRQKESPASGPWVLISIRGGNITAIQHQD